VPDAGADPKASEAREQTRRPPLLPLETPEPVVFPRVGFEAVLRCHDQLVDGACRPLRDQLRKILDPTGEAHLAAWLLPVAGGKTYRLGVGDRVNLARTLAPFPGIVRALLAPKDREDLPFVVLWDPLVSLHRLSLTGVDEPGAKLHVEVSRRSVVVEPAVQTHAATPGFRVTRWLDVERLPRYAWVAEPPARPTYRQLVDRAWALYEPLVSKEIAARLSADPESLPTVLFASSRIEGDVLRVRDLRSSPPETAGLASVEQALRSAPPHAIPVCLALEGFVHLRWLPRRGHERASLPAELTRRRATDEPLDEDETAERLWEVEAVEPRCLKLFEPLGDSPLVDDADTEASVVEIRRLVSSSAAELARQIAAAGFDPAKEQARGPGVRQEVVLALRRTRLTDAESPPSRARPIDHGDVRLTEAAEALAREGKVVAAYRHGTDGRRIHVAFRVATLGAVRRACETIRRIRDEFEGEDVPFELGAALRATGASNAETGIDVTFDLTSFSFTLSSDEVLRRMAIAGKCLDQPRDSLRRPGAPDEGPPRVVLRTIPRDYLRRWVRAFTRPDLRPVAAVLTERGARVRVAAHGLAGLKRMTASLERSNAALGRDGRAYEIVARVAWDDELGAWPEWCTFDLTLRRRADVSGRDAALED
jgi:hypothetical protein